MTEDFSLSLEFNVSGGTDSVAGADVCDGEKNNGNGEELKLDFILFCTGGKIGDAKEFKSF